MLIRSTLLGLAALTLAAAGWVLPTRDGDSEVRVAAAAPAPAAQSCCPYYPYDGSLRFVRIQTSSRYGRYGRGGWSHDYPASDTNMSTILRELTYIRTQELAMGGNVLTFDDPRLMQFPIAYVSEPGDWTVSDIEADGVWAWKNPTSGGHLNWGDGEPVNEQFADDCATILQTDGKWYAEDCTERRAFICEAG